MKIILLISFAITTHYVYSQSCFTYDNAGNRIKRQVCAPASSPSELVQWKNTLLNIDAIYSSSPFETEDISSLIVFPNPSSGTFRFVEQEKLLGKTLVLYNNVGQEIKSILISDQDIDLTEMSSGIYFLLLRSNNKQKISKIIISN